MFDSPMNYDAAAVTSLAATVMALVFGLIPPLAKWFDQLGDWKPLAMALVLLLVDFGKLFYNCQFSVQCVAQYWLPAVIIWVTAFGVNQGVYLAAVEPTQKRLGWKVSKQ